MGTTGFLPGVRFPGDTCELPTKRKSLESSYDRDVQLHLDDDVNSTMSESSSGLGGLDHLAPSKTTYERHHAPGTKALHGHESDVDSGIVSCQLMDNHTASISSSETDSSRESASNEQKSRPSSDPTLCVRFDEQLHLSEENIRRSCRKLFATLYSHRFSYPCYNNNGTLSKAPEVHSVSSSKENAKNEESRVPHIDRPKPHSRLDVAKIDNFLQKYESLRRRYRQNQPMENTTDCSTFGESVVRERDCRAYKNDQKIKLQYWNSESNIVDSSSRLTSDIKEIYSEKAEPTLYSTREMRMNGIKDPQRSFYGARNASSGKEQSNHRSLSVDQRLAHLSPNGFESRKRNCFLHSFPSSHQENSYSSIFNNKTQHNKSLIHKSLSCTVLSSPENYSLSLIPNGKPDPTFPRRTSDPISVSSLNISDGCRSYGLERTSHKIPQVTTRNSMVRAYARIVPIVSDDSNSYTSSNCALKPVDISANPHNGALDKQHSPDPATPKTLSSHSNSTRTKCATTETTATGNGAGQGMKIITSAQERSSYKDLNYSKGSEELKVSTRPQRGRSYISGRNGGVVYSQPNFSAVSSQKHASHKPPSNEAMPSTSRENVSGYKSLTLNHITANGNRKSSKMEYKVLDQSQKNRFNSLPVLDNLATIDTKDGNLPTNSKRGLHQSDFTLYRNRPSPSSSSSGKSFLDRIQLFTRSAKNAVQKAFSTERIYRPEREERYEAEGQKLKRSHSFIRGLRERMSKKKRREKKKKKTRPPAAQVVATQERLNTSWDEPIVGPGSVTHVEGQLLQLNPDGSQVIELTKPPSKPYGFFVARGRIRNSRGVFVSRMRDHETEEHLTGLLGIGDEILEIEGLNVKHADILEVNSLMAQRNSLILTVLPYVCRKD